MFQNFAINPTTSASLFLAETIKQGNYWHKINIYPGDNTTYCRADGLFWQPKSGGRGRWLGNYCPSSSEDAKEYYNLFDANPASCLYLFQFKVPFVHEYFCIFASTEIKTGHWQAKFPKALIPYRKVIEKINL